MEWLRQLAEEYGIFDENLSMEDLLAKLKEMGIIEEVNDTLRMNIPDTGDYDTFSGYILNLIGRIPKEGQQISIGAFTVVVKEREGNRIVAYLVHRMAAPAPPASTTATV